MPRTLCSARYGAGKQSPRLRLCLRCQLPAPACSVQVLLQECAPLLFFSGTGDLTTTQPMQPEGSLDARSGRLRCASLCTCSGVKGEALATTYDSTTLRTLRPPLTLATNRLYSFLRRNVSTLVSDRVSRTASAPMMTPAMRMPVHVMPPIREIARPAAPTSVTSSVHENAW